VNAPPAATAALEGEIKRRFFLLLVRQTAEQTQTTKKKKKTTKTTTTDEGIFKGAARALAKRRGVHGV